MTRDARVPRLVGIVGCGLVGRAMGRRLRAAGIATIGFDLQAEARQAFVDDGGAALDSIRRLGERVEQVIVAVFSSADVGAIVDDPDGLLAAGCVDTLVDCTTGDPERSAAFASRLAARHIGYVEAPWSGSSEQIESGTATLLLAGADDVLTRAAPLLSAMSRHRIVVGAAGMAARAKLATNLVLGLNRAVLAEGFAFAEALGIARERFLELVLATPASSAAAQVKGRMMVEQRFEPPQSRVRQHLKDVELMIAAALSQGLDLPLSAVHRALMQRAVADGDGDLDNAAIVRQWRRT